MIGQQVPTFARDMASVNPAARYSVDKWDGYGDSRSRLFAQLQDAKAPNPIVLSGDVHTHWCADLKADFRKPTSPTIGVEFTNSSVTSGGDGSEVQPAWEVMRGDNPHITYHGNQRGYIACTATPKTMRADFRVIEKVTVPNAAGADARRWRGRGRTSRRHDVVRKQAREVLLSLTRNSARGRGTGRTPCRR